MQAVRKAAGGEAVEAAAPPPGPAPAAAPRPERLVSLDAYRGFIMLVLAASGLSLDRVAASFRGSAFWDAVGYQFSHVAWRGCGFWDLIQPSFMFMVGVAVPYSYASRKAKGEPDAKILAHTIYRSLLLVLLGVFLSSVGRRETHWTFVNVLSQIGLGYTFVTLLRGRGLGRQLAAAGALVAGAWALFVLYPLPGPGFDPRAVGVPAGFQAFDGLAAHWNKNANAASAFDLWFLNLFPPHEFKYNDGGYTTLNFVPSMVTMILGLVAGELLRSGRTPRAILRRLLAAAGLCLGAGVVLDPQIVPGVEGLWVIAPIVKRLWTPSWAIFSTGWTLAMLAGFYYVIDIRGWRRWAFPLVVVGMNSIAMYLMGQLMRGWVRQQMETHVGRGIFAGAFGPLWASLGIAIVLWLICFWMYRRKVFLRI